mgnify:FL=1
MTPEGKVKKKVKALLDERGVYYFMPATAGYGRSGVPDIICCYFGYFLAIECKAGGNKPTALQLREMQRIAKANGTAMVVDDSEESLDALSDLLHIWSRQ